MRFPILVAYSRENLVKVYRSYRFDPQLYAAFKKITQANNSTITDAFQTFMRSCVEANKLAYAEKPQFEIEASVLSDWLTKGKRFYRDETGNEINVQGRLFSLLPKIHDNVFKKEIESCLKNSVTGKQQV
jgi:hypothetical protein